MKNKLLFAENRLVFHVAENPKNPLEGLHELDRKFNRQEEVTKADVDKAVEEAKKNLENPELSIEERSELNAKFRRLERALYAKVRAAEIGHQAETGKVKSYRELWDLMERAELDVETAVTMVRSYLEDTRTKNISELKQSMRASESFADAELKKDLESMTTNLEDITIAIPDGVKPDKSMVDSYLAMINAESYESPKYLDAFQRQEARTTAREKRTKLTEKVKEMLRTEKWTLPPRNEELITQLEANLKWLEEYPEPDAGKSASEWTLWAQGLEEGFSRLEAYVAEKSEKFDKENEDFEAQEELYEEVGSKIDGYVQEITDYIRSLKNEDKVPGESFDDASAKIIGRLLQLKEGLGKPEKGNFERQNEYKSALQDATLAKNDFKAEMNIQKLADAGGEKLVKVYEKYKSGGFKSSAEFKAAWDQAMQESQPSGYKSQDVATREQLRVLADAGKILEETAMYALRSQELKKFGEEMAQSGKSALDAMKGLMDKAGEGLAEIGKLPGKGAEVIADAADAAARQAAEREQMEGEKYQETVQYIESSIGKIETPNGKNGKEALAKLNRIKAGLKTPDSNPDSGATILEEYAAAKGEAEGIMNDYLPKLVAYKKSLERRGLMLANGKVVNKPGEAARKRREQIASKEGEAIKRAVGEAADTVVKQAHEILDQKAANIEGEVEADD